MRRVIPFLLAMVLALSLGGQGAARLAASGSTIVLCTGDGAVTVTLGPDGTPVIGHPHCPDCLPLAALDATAAALPARRATEVSRIVIVPGTHSAPATLPLHPPARGPPSPSVA